MQNTSRKWNTRGDRFGKSWHYSSPKFGVLTIFFMSHIAHSLFCFSAILAFLIDISWIIFFSLWLGNSYFICGKTGLLHFLAHSSILSGQPAILNFAKELCSQTLHFLCASLKSFSPFPILCYSVLLHGTEYCREILLVPGNILLYFYLHKLLFSQSTR